MNPTELINPKCKITGTTPVIRSTKHLFLDLPKLSDQLQDYITTTSQLVSAALAVWNGLL
jgi:methionyl-tRNA synthetase